jgi:hypothetical protein
MVCGAVPVDVKVPLANYSEMKEKWLRSSREHPERMQTFFFVSGLSNLFIFPFIHL